MKRIFAFLLATVMILSTVSVSPAIASSLPTFSVSDAKGSAGEQVNLSINIESNPGVIAVGLQIGYDSSVLELKNAAVKDFADTSFGPTSGNPFNISWEDVLNPNNTQNGTVAELTFLIRQDVAPGDYKVTVSYVEDNVFNSDFDNVHFATKSGRITVTEQSVAVTGVNLEKSISVNIGEKKTPAYTVNPDNATDKTVSFIISDPSVASVDKISGEITGVKKGTATLTVITSDGGFTDTCTVTVSCAHAHKTPTAEKASSCTEKGWDTYSQCNICGQLLNADGEEIDEIPYLALAAHTPGDHVKENEIGATCENAGSYDDVVYCTVCRTEISRSKKTVSPLKHDWNEGRITTPASCTTNGVRTFICKRDASHTYTEVISATGHTHGKAVTENRIPASCSFTGSFDEVVYCSVCHEEVSRKTKVIPIDSDAHDWGDWVQKKAPTSTESGEEIRTCKHNPSHYETRSIPPIGPDETEYSFLNGEVVITVPSDAIPNNATLDVKKIVPPPQDTAEKLKNQYGDSSSVLSYYEIRLTADDGTPIIRLKGEITVKIKIPQEYLGHKRIRLLQEDASGTMFVMTSWREDNYLCYKTDWLEIY